MSGIGSKEIEAGSSTAPESAPDAEIVAESAVEEDVSPQTGLKRRIEVSADEPPRKRLEASGVGSYFPLHAAADRGNCVDVRELLAAGADTRCQNEEGQTALHFALDKWQFDAADIISDKDAGCNVQDKNGCTPLHYAARLGHTSVIRNILAAAEDTRCQECDVEMTQLHLAFNRSQNGAAKLISDKGALCNVQDKNGCTPLHYATNFEDVKTVGMLLAAGADTRCQDRHKRTPLHFALHRRQERVAELMSDKDGGHCLQDINGETPLHRAARYGYVRVVELLLAAGAGTRCQDREGMPPVHRALDCRKDGAAENISDDYAGINLLDMNGCTPLHWAASGGKVEIVEKLLAAGADTRCQNHDKRTPLHSALFWFQEKSAECLSDVDAGNNLPDKYGLTPLHWAAIKGSVTIVKKLLAPGVNIRCQDLKQMTPLHLALHWGREAVAELITDEDGDNNLQDKNGHTPLYLASAEPYVGVVRKLLWSGAHPHLLANTGESAFVKALKTEHCDTIKMFVSMCALRNIVIDWENVSASQDRLQSCKKLFAECASEIQRMKETKVLGGSISYYDVACKHVSKVAAYLGNNEIREELLKENATRTFLIYAELITFRVEKAEKRRILNDRCLEGFAAISRQLACLPEIVVDKIFPYLTDYEMRNFERAFTG